MKPVDIFAVAVRIVGLIICAGTGNFLFFALINLVLGGPANVTGLAIVSLPPFLVGLWFLRGAPGVIAFAYPGENRSASN